MIRINGEELALAGQTLAAYLEGTSYDPQRIAVERNDLSGLRTPPAALD